MSTYYIIDNDVTLSEKVDLDTVVINLSNGCYYNFNATASYIWELIGAGTSKDEIVTQYSDSFKLSKEETDSEVSEILNTITSGDLARLVTEKPVVAIQPVEIPAYITPQIETFDDMQEMLLLDPIHEVTEKGWPYKNDE